LDHPLRDLSNVTLSPHLGYVSDDNYKVGMNLLCLRSNSK
jgi:phosphoglycerate dehydrogenase-like enzyme